MANNIRTTPSSNYADSNVTRDELREEARGIREDFIVVFGIFASILIFLGIEVQVFQHAPKFSYIVGLSLFLLGSLQAFVLTLINTIKVKNDIKKDYFLNPIVWFICLAFIGSVICFLVGKYTH